MKRNLLYTATLTLLVACVLPNNSQAQEVQEAQEITVQAQDTEREFYLRPSYWRAHDKKGLNVFETTKKADPIPLKV